MTVSRHSPAEKAAIVLLTIGEDAAAEVLKQLPKPEVKRILSAVARLGRIDQLTSDQVMTEFAETMQTMKKGIEGSPQAAARFLHQFSKMRGIDFDPSSIIDFATPALRETLAPIDTRSLSAYLAKEHPQVIALIAVHLEPKRMGTVLKSFPTSLKTDIIQRIAALESVDPEIISDIEETIRKEFDNSTIRTQRLGGVEKIAATMNTLSSEEAENCLSELAQKDPDLAESVRASMFTFKDLLRLDTRSVAALIKLATPADLKAALRGADEEILQHFFSAMSQRAAALLQEDIAAGGKLPLTVIQAARAQLAATARRLLAAGELNLIEDLQTHERSA